MTYLDNLWVVSTLGSLDLQADMLPIELYLLVSIITNFEFLNVNNMELTTRSLSLQCRDSGNDFRFPDFASQTGRFCLIFVCISSVVSFLVIYETNYSQISEIRLLKFAFLVG